MKMLAFIILYGFTVIINSDKFNEYQSGNQVLKNGMEVSWKYNNDRIYFEIQAPTEGWVTIGFNSNDGMAGCYLLMGRVKNGNVEVAEHYTQRPGDYSPISKYDVTAQVADPKGKEESDLTNISFILPLKAISKYQKDLFPNSEYIMVLAYSIDDDFQHHSIMRTSIKVKL